MRRLLKGLDTLFVIVLGIIMSIPMLLLWLGFFARPFAEQ